MDDTWTFFFIHLCLILFSLQFTSTLKQSESCYFPKRWEGTWFQTGVQQPILIEGQIFSTKGRCLSSEANKFLLVDDKQNCYRCIIIQQKHANELQYKQTDCHGGEAVSTICGLLSGDSLVYFMFRENAVAIPCPFRGGPFTFTYNRGYGECRSPVSSIDTCTENSKLLLSYQSCPDVHGSESAIVELECLAVWKEGSSRYLVGKFHHTHTTSNEDRLRCFLYNRVYGTDVLDGEGGYRIAQSADASCNGLFSATEGNNTMTLRTVTPTNKCEFPYWLTNFNHWHTLDYSSTYSFHHRDATLRITNSSGTEMKILCIQRQKHFDENVAILITHFTMGCQNGYIGMTFYRKNDNVIVVQTGSQTNRIEDAISSDYFDNRTQPYVPLLSVDKHESVY